MSEFNEIVRLCNLPTRSPNVDKYRGKEMLWPNPPRTSPIEITASTSFSGKANFPNIVNAVDSNASLLIWFGLPRSGVLDILFSPSMLEENKIKYDLIQVPLHTVPPWTICMICHHVDGDYSYLLLYVFFVKKIKRFRSSHLIFTIFILRNFS